MRTGYMEMKRNSSGISTAPFARTVENSTIVTPKMTKFQLAISWIWRAIGKAGLVSGTNSVITCRSNRMTIATITPVSAIL